MCDESCGESKCVVRVCVESKFKGRVCGESFW